MLIVIPYPNGKKYVTDGPDHLAERKEQIEIIRNYVAMICSGPWQSDHGDILWGGVRIRLGRQQDYFMLQLKYGTAKEY